MELLGTEWQGTLAWLGLIFLLKNGFGILVNIYYGWKSFVLPRVAGWICQEDYVKKFGKWAVVTGCTGGIGKEYALALAQKKMSLVLVSRSKQKLDELANEISRLHKVETMIIVADFTKVEVLDEIVAKLKESKVDIGILVNNVGILGPHWQPFLELDSKIVRDMVTVNITAATVLCHELLPAMVKKGKGAVINIASIASLCTGPYLAEYYATKHYLHAFTEAISIELEGTGVIVQEVDPGQVATEMTKDFAPGPGVPLADAYVATALPTLGFSQRTTGYWAHGLIWLQTTMISDWLMGRFAKMVGRRQYEHALEKHRKSQ